MGGSLTKSPLERRNTVARRSQRRTIHNIKSRVERILQDVKRFKGTEEDENFEALISELDHTRIELMRKATNLQPQIKQIHDITNMKIDECEQALRNKLLENQRKAKNKEEAALEKAKKIEEKNKNKADEQENDDIIISEEENEAERLAASTDKRKTVEVKFVQIVSPGEESEVTESQGRSSTMTSPQDKRKSILKVGVPVMPGAILNDISAKLMKLSKNKKSQNNEGSVSESEVKENEIYTILSKNAHDTDETTDLETRIHAIINNLQTLECQIADFIGRKNGTQYNRIKNQLVQYLIELNDVNTSDEHLKDKLNSCRTYINSNITFLDDKAIDDKMSASNDDVFLETNNNAPVSPVDAEMKYRKLTKTTAI